MSVFPVIAGSAGDMAIPRWEANGRSLSVHSAPYREIATAASQPRNDRFFITFLSHCNKASPVWVRLSDCKKTSQNLPHAAHRSFIRYGAAGCGPRKQQTPRTKTVETATKKTD